MNKIASYEELSLKIAFLQKEAKFNDVFLKKLFDVIPNPMFYKDKNGVYQHCNDAFSKIILGIPKEQIMEKLFMICLMLFQKRMQMYIMKKIENFF